MKPGIFITRHAIARYIERIDPCATEAEADAAIRSHSAAIIVAADFGCRTVRLGSGAKLVLDDRNVVTVLGRHQIARDALPL